MILLVKSYKRYAVSTMWEENRDVDKKA